MTKEKNELTKKIMKGVARYEKKQATNVILKMIFIILVTFVTLALSSWIFYLVLKITDSLALLELILESREVVRIYGFETLFTIFLQTPNEVKILVGLSLALAITVTIITVRTLPRVIKRFKSLGKYLG